jgi:hypothetical protein
MPRRTSRTSVTTTDLVDIAPPQIRSDPRRYGPNTCGVDELITESGFRLVGFGPADVRVIAPAECGALVC